MSNARQVLLMEAIRRAGSLDGEKVRNAMFKMDLNSVFGAFTVDRDGFQIGHEMVMFQWQEVLGPLSGPITDARGKRDREA